MGRRGWLLLLALVLVALLDKTRVAISLPGTTVAGASCSALAVLLVIVAAAAVAFAAVIVVRLAGERVRA